MSEAEVSLRLALYLLRNGIATSDVSVAIDGAQVKTADQVHFRMADFLQAECRISLGVGTPWQRKYAIADCSSRLVIHSSPGKGDVVAALRDGSTLRVESKKGPLTPSRSSVEYPLLREALGQLLTIDELDPRDQLAVAVPASSRFAKLAEKWSQAPLVRQLNLRFLLVGRDGSVTGIPSLRH